MITDASNKNNVALSIAHIYFFNNSLKKTLHHAISIISIETELFTIRCEISQAVQIQEVLYIIVITDAIHAVKKFFNPSIYLYQQQLITISKEIRTFFSKHEDNTIEFWDCSNNRWHLHKVVDKENKYFNLVLLYPSKVLWNLSKKRE